MSSLNPTFRADHVGSLLRTDAVLTARRRRATGEIDDAELRHIEDEAIASMIPKLEATGIESITDGEFHRAWFHLDFLEQLAGVSVTGAAFDLRVTALATGSDFELDVTGTASLVGLPVGISLDGNVTASVSGGTSSPGGPTISIVGDPITIITPLGDFTGRLTFTRDGESGSSQSE